MDFVLTHVEKRLWIVQNTIGLSLYDFDFAKHFSCRHPIRIDQPITAIARMGAADIYSDRYTDFANQGINLIHTPEQYELSTLLPNWYPKISDLTPHSRWFDDFPDAGVVDDEFGWPVFIKGERQTTRHNRSMAIAESEEHFKQICMAWGSDPVLAWQRMVCRKFEPLRSLYADTTNEIPKSYEFRCFCWNGVCVGIGNYWVAESYQPTPSEHGEITQLAETVANRLSLPFLVVDIAQCVDGRWIVIECNDGQDSGYTGVNRIGMWNRILELL